MKTSNAITVVTDREIEREIAQKHESIKEITKRNAMYFGKQCLPEPTGATLSSYISETKSQYTEMITSVDQKLQLKAHNSGLDIDRNTATNKIRENEHLIASLKKQNDVERHEIGDVELPSESKRIIMPLLLVVSVMCEAVWNISSFETLHVGKLAALIIGIGTSCGMMELAFFTVRRSKEAEAARQKKRWHAIGLIVATVVILVLAYLRTHVLSHYGTSVSIFTLALMNIFLFGVMYVAIYEHALSKGEKAQIAKFRKRLKAVEGREKQVKRLENETKLLEESIRLKEIRLKQLSDYIQTLYARIESMYQETVELFKTVNLIHRSDKKTPECFSEDIPQLVIERK